ncbi:MAG: hypothetical protein WBG50_22630 [Desulfomonilaceae bacterium]
MNSLVSELREAAEFLEKYPKLETSSDLAAPLKSLSKTLVTFLGKAETLRLEQLPGYAEVAALLEGDGKAVATPEFMQNFCKAKLKQRFTAAKADKKSRAQFLKIVAKGDRLMAVKKELDPKKRGRDLFDELRRLDLNLVKGRLSAMPAKDLTLLVEANGFAAPKTGTGLVSKKGKSLDQIVSQISQVKLSEHY